MLILYRDVGQSIFIGKNAEIKIKVLVNDGRFVKLGIDAPHQIPIYREEIFYRAQKATAGDELILDGLNTEEAPS